MVGGIQTLVGESGVESMLESSKVENKRSILLKPMSIDEKL
jgi:hypothetical protein